MKCSHKNSGVDDIVILKYCSSKDEPFRRVMLKYLRAKRILCKNICCINFILRFKDHNVYHNKISNYQNFNEKVEIK
jgi:hypothetical protein